MSAKTQKNSNAKDEPLAIEHGEDRRVLQRLIFPTETAPDIIPLYIERGQARNTSAGGSFGLGSGKERGTQTDIRQFVNSQPMLDASELVARHSVRVPSGEMRSFGTYFNAFPASYWRRWTPVREVRLTISTKGTGQIIVYRSNARGSMQRHDLRRVSGNTVTVFDLPLAAFGDGGWYWFDIHGGTSEITVLEADWSTDASLARTRGTISISMTTMNKVSYCLDNIRAISEDPAVREVLDTMYVIDQGSDRLRDHAEDLAPLAKEMGDQLTIIEQGNIGGSGGFSRGMYETTKAGRSTYVVNSDDDIVIEPESLLRLVTFADYATTPTLVGAHMFDLNNRSVLHTFGEIVDPWRIQPALPHDDMVLGHDFSESGLRSTPWLHRRVDVDYNGWWMCLIPVEAIRKIGLSLPVFIKWDDAEYGLRARNAGFPTVSLPGAGVWHISWTDKDDLVGWQAYFHERNRIITALLHSPYDHGGRVVKESQFMDIKHILSMQYYTQKGRLMAQRDVLDGPDALHGNIGTKLPEIRALAASFSDAHGGKDVTDFPPTKVDKPPHKGRPFSQPWRPLVPLWTLKTLARQFAVKPKPGSDKNPQAVIAHQDARWWRLAHYDSALVSNAEGTQVSWYRRDPETSREMLVDAVKVHAELFRRWSQLRDDYREAAGRICSLEAWEKTFEAATPKSTEGSAR
ncbi:glycosyltransferase [Devriesea agamarum]|uniref:glycosyltransferase n=1 Tax=Devriesea agamarum TaxID=472569 RepID=UPI00071D6394|nr:glycosyltransferase [Devriesea agamarum]